MSAANHRRLPAAAGLFATAVAAMLLAGSALAQHAAPSSSRRAPARDAAAPSDASANGSSAPLAASDASTGDASSAPAGDAEVDVLAARRVRAGEEFATGVAAYRRGDFVAAANHFNVAFETLPDPAPLFNMARAWEGANEIERAITAYQHYLDLSPTASDRADVLERITVLRSRPTEVFVSSDPAGAFVYLDEETDPQRDTTPMVLRVVPGPHVIVIDREGHRRAVRRFTARPGVTETLAVALENNAGAAPANTTGSRVDARILNRRTTGLLSTRFSFLVGAARPWNNQPFSLSVGGAATLFIGRGITSTLHFERVEPDGVWTIVTGDFGYTLGIEDIDLALLATAGVGYGWLDYASYMNRSPLTVVPLLGFEARAEWVFHPHISAGLWFRATWRNFFVAPIEPLNSLGLSISLLF